jgi:hypothetical protein
MVRSLAGMDSWTLVDQIVGYLYHSCDPLFNFINPDSSCFISSTEGTEGIEEKEKPSLLRTFEAPGSSHLTGFHVCLLIVVFLLLN